MFHVKPYASDTAAVIALALRECDIEVSGTALPLLAAHLDAVLELNQVLNLTRIDDPLEAAYLHVADSLLALSEVDGAAAGRILDIGTGGGFPGLPLSIASGRGAALLDSVKKKASAVQSIVERLGLSDSVVAIGERAEEHAATEGGAYQVVTARAVSQLPSLVELAAPLLAAGGRLVCLKGRMDASELNRGDEVAAIVGLSRLSLRPAQLPGDRGERTIVCYSKVREPSLKLPRRTGLAQHSPLA